MDKAVFISATGAETFINRLSEKVVDRCRLMSRPVYHRRALRGYCVILDGVPVTDDMVDVLRSATD